MPLALSGAVRRYVHNNLSREKEHNAMDFTLQALSDDLRMDVLFHLRCGFLSQGGFHDFFERAPKQCQRRLCSAVQQVFFVAGEQVFKCGEVASVALFVMRGTVVVVLPADEDEARAKKIIESPCVIGEMCLFKDEEVERTAHVVAGSDIDCLVLSRRAFQDVLVRDPHLRQHFVTYTAQQEAKDQQLLVRQRTVNAVSIQTRKTQRLSGKVEPTTGRDCDARGLHGAPRTTVTKGKAMAVNDPRGGLPGCATGLPDSRWPRSGEPRCVAFGD